MNTGILIWILIMIFVAARIAYRGRRIKVSKVDKKEIKDPDQIIIDTLIKEGSNPEKEHMLEFAFRGNSANISRLKEEMTSEGYQYKPAQSEQDRENTQEWLIIIKPYKLHIDEIRKELDVMNAFAGKNGVEFDGWGTEIEP